MNILKIEAF